MQVGLHTRLKVGVEQRYEDYHRAVWPDVFGGNALRVYGLMA
jgi:L-rhamnose mutarotase